MSKFLDWATKRAILEAAKTAKTANPQQQAGEVESEFAKARQSLDSLINDRFQQMMGQIQKSFGSQLKIDQVSTTKIVNTLYSIANHLKKIGGVGQQPTSQPNQEMVDHIVSLFDKAETLTENTEGMKIQSVNQYLTGVKDEIMQSIDKILQGLQRDIINHSITNVANQIGQLQGTVGEIDKRLQSNPLSHEEKKSLFYGLAQLGSALNIQKRKFGGKVGGDIKIMGGKGKIVTFDPKDKASINNAIQSLEDPRNTRMMIDGKPYMVDLTDNDDIANLLDVINSRVKLPKSKPVPDSPPVQVDPNAQTSPLQPINNSPKLSGQPTNQVAI